MKKFLATAGAAVMLAGGAVGFTTTAAHADCPYTGCIPTATTVDAPDEVAKGSKAKICVRVRTEGNGRPKGDVTLTVRRSKGEFRWIDVKKYNDKKECFTTPKLKKKGNYIVKARFTRNPNGSWAPSTGFDELRVVRRG